jgi:hypothetical protein
MTAEGNLIIRRRGRTEGWEHEEKGSYDIETLREEYRRRLYSEKGYELLKQRQTAEPKARNDK